MFDHIVKAEYFTMVVDKRTFNHIFNRRTLHVVIKKSNKWNNKLVNKNEFIRFVSNNANWYMDVEIRKIENNHTYVVHLGNIIDYNKPMLKTKSLAIITEGSAPNTRINP